MSEKFMGVYLDEDKINKFHLLALKEKKKLKQLHLEIIEDYIKKHQDGNPQFTMDQFKDPDFIACPAFYRASTYWDYYCKKQDNEELEKLKSQLLIIEQTILRYL